MEMERSFILLATTTFKNCPMKDMFPCGERRDPQTEPGCYTGYHRLITLQGNATMASPICKESTSVGAACISSMANNNITKCVPSNFFTINGAVIHGSCSCPL